tara:strand:- start:200 stop:871 length:672 start_codon:yes stop_codon:yes gene_type:complete
MLKITSLNKRYEQPDGDVQVLQDLDFELRPGRTAALLGESGSGKSTLLHLIAGLDKPNTGTITIDDKVVSDFTEAEWNTLRRQTLSLVFQQYHLVPTLRVADNIRIQARLAGRMDESQFDHLVERLGLAGLLGRFPHQLSGGQQQRVAIARALMHQPRLVLADEPTGNLDEETSRGVMQLFVELVKETGSSLLMVTHSQAMASYLDSRWLLHNGAITEVTLDG